MKKIFSIILAVLMVASFTACAKGEGEVSSAPSDPVVIQSSQVNEESSSLPDSVASEVDSEPDDGVVTVAEQFAGVPLNGQVQIDMTEFEGKTVAWSSENKEIAVVGEDGLITGRNEGTTFVIGNDGEKLYPLVVTVSADGNYDYDASAYAMYSDAYDRAAIEADIEAMVVSLGVLYGQNALVLVEDKDITVVNHGDNDAIQMRLAAFAAVNECISNPAIKTEHQTSDVVGCIVRNGDNDWTIQIAGVAD